jgi:hypothetical protein
MQKNWAGIFAGPFSYTALIMTRKLRLLGQ